MRRRYPLEILTLPYACDGSCCGAAYTREALRARPRPVGSSWEVSVTREGVVVDVFRDADLNTALVAVHCAYPGATFDPEEGL